MNNNFIISTDGKIEKYIGDSEKVFIPERINNINIEAIGHGAFQECMLKEIAFAEGLNSIEEGAFFSCFQLSKVKIPDSVSNIGAYAFCRCGELESFYLPNGVKEISESTFSFCTKLETIRIPSSVTCIKNFAFQSCKSLKSIIYSGSLEEWESIEIQGRNEALRYASIMLEQEDGTISLKKKCDDTVKISDVGIITGFCGSPINLVISEKVDGILVDGISDYAFSFCDNLTDVVIQCNIIKMGIGAFMCCNNLAHVDIRSNITTIDDSVFMNCDSLVEIFLPDSITTIKNGAFMGCNKLKTIVYSGTMKKWKNIVIESHNDALLHANVIALGQFM